MVEINHKVRSDAKYWMNKRRADNKKKSHPQGPGSREEIVDATNDRPNLKWWETEWSYPGGSGDEAEWNWWYSKGKVVDLEAYREASPLQPRATSLTFWTSLEEKTITIN